MSAGAIDGNIEKKIGRKCTTTGSQELVEVVQTYLKYVEVFKVDFCSIQDKKCTSKKTDDPLKTFNLNHWVEVSLKR